MRRQIRFSADPMLKRLLDEALSYPGGEHGLAAAEFDGPVIPVQVKTRLGVLSFLSATIVFGSPADVTLEEIALETLYPADSITDQAVRRVRAKTPERAV
jgi:hypothetical protein